MDNKFIKNGSFRPYFIIIMFAFPLLMALSAVCIGRINISVNEIVKVFINLFQGKEFQNQTSSIVINLRLPRIITALIVGAGISCAGVAFQSIFSNPLATPDILGVSAGTSVGAIIAIILSFNVLQIQLLGLLFGLFAVFITIKISAQGNNSSIIMIVLSGIIISSLFNAFASLLKYTADPLDKLPQITYWLLGSFSGATYKKIIIGSPFILIGIIIIFLLRWQLNILSLNDEEAKSRGIDVFKLRITLITAATLITASSVAMCGQISWIGLLVPHLTRMIVGSNNRLVIPLSLSIGAGFMVIIDTLSRSISVVELPISILTAILGAPAFILLLNKAKGNLR